jgi:universal stress protein A
MIAIERILAPTDFSPPAQAAFGYAVALAERFNAALHVLHVLEDPLIYVPTTEGYAALPDFREAMEKDAREHLEQLLTPPQRQQLRAELVMVWGRPFVEIIRYAETHRMDLIVMGTHGRGMIAQLLMGSVAKKVVRKAPCPVLTVRPPPPAEAPVASAGSSQ